MNLQRHLPIRSRDLSAPAFLIATLFAVTLFQTSAVAQDPTTDPASAPTEATGAAGAAGAAGAENTEVTPSASPTLPEGPMTHEYRIQVKLQADTMTLEGVNDVTVRNLSGEPIDEVVFRLMPNAWSRTDTLWMEDSGRAADLLERGAGGAGYMEIQSVTDSSRTGPNISATIEETLMRIDLAEPIAAGAETTISIAFCTRLPEILARMGKVGSHVNAMQWYPKLTKLGPDQRFLRTPFREPSEFFADFGDYDVEITVPEAYVIGATGVRTGSSTDTTAGTRTETFSARRVIDFAWCANPNFQLHSDTTARGVAIELLAQPYMDPKAELTLAAARFAMERLDEWLFPYPYERLVIDVMPHGIRGGMEYPMLFTIGARAPEAFSGVANRSENPSSVTIHEYVHQYFQGMVATNEIDEAWLDEGLTTYLTAKILEEFWNERHGAPEPRRGLPVVAAERVYQTVLGGDHVLARAVGHPTSPFLPDRASLLGFDPPDLVRGGSRTDRFLRRKSSYAPYATSSDLRAPSYDALRTRDGNAYGSTAYSKPTLMLRTLEGMVGWDATRHFLGEHARRHAFQHPTVDDFLALAANVLDDTASDFLTACVETNGTVDWSVEAVRVRQIGGVGFSPQQKPGDPVTSEFTTEAGGETTIDRIREAVTPEFMDDGSPKESVTSLSDSGGETPSYEAEVWIHNHGSLRVPFEVELRFFDGQVDRRAFDGQRTTYRIELEPSEARLISAEVDPDRRVALDLNVTNNSRLARRDNDSIKALGAFPQFWIQSLISIIGWSA